MAPGDFPAKGRRQGSCLWFVTQQGGHFLKEDKLEGSQGGLATLQDFGKRGGAMLQVHHEQKILSTGQLCAQDIEWNLSLSQSCPVEVLARILAQKTLSRPSTPPGSTPCPRVPMASATPGGDTAQLRPPAPFLWMVLPLAP